MASNPIIAYIGMGSNLGDRAGNLLLAVRAMIEASFYVNRLSAIYETEPVGIDTDLKFLNMVAEVEIHDVTPSAVMARLLRIEYALGRGDKSVKKPRTVDLDILFFSGDHIDTEFLTIPHPRLHLRKFVLCPLAELAPELVHPLLNTSVSDLLIKCEDSSEVKRWFPDGSQDHGIAANS